MVSSIAFRKSWVLVREQSKFVDWQKVKVQEKSDEVLVTKLCCDSTELYCQTTKATKLLVASAITF